AESRGVTVKVSTKDEAKGHNSTVRVKVISAEGNTSVLEGALTGIDGVEKIVRIDGRGVDMRATGRNIFFSYSDRPGALGVVGSELGHAGVNIQAGAVTEGKKSDPALGQRCGLDVDASVDPGQAGRCRRAYPAR